MTPAMLIDHIGVGLVAQLLAATMGFFVALLAGVFMLRGKAVPAVVLGIPVALPASAMLLSALLGMWGAGEGADYAAWLDAVGAGIGNRLLAPFFVAPVAMILLLFTTVEALRHGVYSWRRPLAVMVFLGAAVLSPIACGVMHDDLPYPVIRTVCYGVLALMTALSFAWGDASKGRGPEAAAAAGLCFAVAVAAGECSQSALMVWQLLIVGHGMPVDAVGEFVAQGMTGVIDPRLPYSWFAMGAAFCVGGFGVIAAALAREEGRGIALLAGLWLALIPAMFFLGDPTAVQIETLLRLKP